MQRRARNHGVLSKPMQRVVWAMVLALVATGPFIAASALADSPPGEIRFIGKNALAKAKGTFHDWKVVEVEIDPQDLSAGHVVVEVDVASVDTDNKRRDDHLRTADFFEVERWPTARVRVHSAKPIEGDRYTAQFDLEIRDQRKTVEGVFEITGRAPLQVRGELTIDRMDFGVGEPKTWNPLSITQEIPIRFEATLP